MRNPLLLGLVVGGIIVLAGLGLLKVLNIGPLASDSRASISGSLDINGVIPVGAEVTVTASEYNKSEGSGSVKSETVTAIDGQNWSVHGLGKGKTYSVVATVKSGDTTISKSDVLVVTAPADQESLRINIESENGQANATISGNVVVNGYIPSGSSITVQGRVAGEVNFTTIASGLPGQAKQFMSYTTAVEGESYEVRGVLMSGGTQIGTSQTIVITAPAANEILTINSSAQAPVTPAPTTAPNQSPTPGPANQTISGSINFNGVAPTNSRIVILAKVYNASNYQVVVNNVSPTNGASWSWSGAAPSTWYDVQAVLKQSQSNNTDKDIADSQIASIAAPASNVTLNINSGVQIPAPSGQVSMLCGNQSGSQWNATLTLPYVSGAQSYWYQVGTSNNSSNISNATVNANGNNNVQVNVALPNQQNVYFQYAYANVPNVGTGNSQFSPFSSTSQGDCGN